MMLLLNLSNALCNKNLEATKIYCIILVPVGTYQKVADTVYIVKKFGCKKVLLIGIQNRFGQKSWLIKLK